jgi:ribosome-binding protein aMBF1 (putative translation factor)
LGTETEVAPAPVGPAGGVAARLGVVMHEDRSHSGERAPATMQELVAAAESAAFDVWKKYGLCVLDAIERCDLTEAADKASRLAQRLAQLAALADGQRQAARLIERHREREREREDQHVQASPNRIPWFRVASGLTLAQAAERIGVDEDVMFAYETGDLAVPDGHRLALADLYGCASVPYLMNEEAGSRS